MQQQSGWFEREALALLDERNRREVGFFADLVGAYQQLLFRHTLSASSTSLGASVQLTNPNGSSGDPQSQIDAVAQKYLSTIQHLERELSDKNAQLAEYAGNQLHLVNESKELLQAQDQWEKQLQFFTKRLEEEMLLNEEKDRVIKELDAALHLVREELARHRVLLEKTESDNASLRERIAQLEAQLLRKSVIMQEWLAAHEAGDYIKRGGQNSDDSKSLLPPSNSMASQEMAENMSHLFIDSNIKNTSILVARVAYSIRAHATEVNSVSFNASGKILFSGSSDGTVRAWEASTCRPMGEYRGVGTAHPLLCVRGSEDGEFVLGTGCDRKCFIWRVGTGRVYQTLVGHKGKVLAGEFSRVSPTEVITGSSDRSMRVWDITKGRSLQTINCQSSCNDIAMTLGGQFASAHQDGVVRFWDTRTKHIIHEMKDLHQDQCTSVSFSQNGNQLLSNSRDHKLHVIDPRMYEKVMTLQHPGYQCGFDWCKASLSPDGLYAAAGSSSGSLFIWNTRTGKLEKEHHVGHHGAIACCIWRPDGEGIASCDKNGFLVLWE
ncbi:Wd40 repeat protein tipd, partial [Globisporangium splendens]